MFFQFPPRVKKLYFHRNPALQFLIEEFLIQETGCTQFLVIYLLLNAEIRATLQRQRQQNTSARTSRIFRDCLRSDNALRLFGVSYATPSHNYFDQENIGEKLLKARFRFAGPSHPAGQGQRVAELRRRLQQLQHYVAAVRSSSASRASSARTMPHLGPRPGPRQGAAKAAARVTACPELEYSETQVEKRAFLQ